MKNYRIWVYLAIALAVAYVMAFRPDYVGNVGFLILGAVIAIGSSLFIEESKREREISELARAIHHELANRVARCCFDFEAPWYRFYKGGYKADEMGAIRLLKFVPVPPVIYPAVGSQIARLHPDIAQSVITFYFFLAAWERDIHNIAAHWQREQKTVPASDVMFLAKRLHQAIAPGLTALDRLDAMIENAVEAERNAIANWTELFGTPRPTRPSGNGSVSYWKRLSAHRLSRCRRMK